MSNENHIPGLTPEEAKQHAWLDALSATERAEMEQTWKLAVLGREAEPNTQSVSEAWALVENRLNEARALPLQPGRLRLIAHLSTVRRAAVAAVLLFALGYYLWLRPVTIESASGAIVEYVLPDGSNIVLSSGSSVSFNRGLRGSIRRVSLHGEAFFGVKASDLPFVVETFNAAVEVIGTQFNVRARESDVMPETEVALVEGAVRFTSREVSGHAAYLEPGQFSSLPSGAIKPTEPMPIHLNNIASWRNGGFAFESKPLSTILSEIERRYDIQISMLDELRDDSLVLFHDKPENVEVLLDAISAFKGYRYRVTSTGYELIR